MGNAPWVSTWTIPALRAEGWPRPQPLTPTGAKRVHMPRQQAIILASSYSVATLQGEGNLSLTLVRFGSRPADTLAMGARARCRDPSRAPHGRSMLLFPRRRAALHRPWLRSG